MSDIAIKAEDVGKLYRLGQIGTGTISHDLNRWWAKMRGKEDPFAKIGETNDRTTKGGSEYVWALKDVNFEIKKGEAVGIIGRNGAGKSTLLKLLSKVTKPTSGNIKVNGRIASLLEVGTGFHPEMTGRENIYLNGAILGMTKKEITRKFDEIVDFSGVERYIDTPVKRYSSGMYVRLAFAVAAHLESEILIVDEVLAVGDAEFQKKCLGKMEDVSKGEGRTVLLVSRNLGSVANLCSKAIVMELGKVGLKSSVSECIEYYLVSKANNFSKFNNRDLSNSKIDIKEIEILNAQDQLSGSFAFNEPIFVQLKIQNSEGYNNAVIMLRIKDNLERLVFTSQLDVVELNTSEKFQTIKIQIPPNVLVPNNYNVIIGIHIPNIEWICLYEKTSFKVNETGSLYTSYSGSDYGCVFVNCFWTDQNNIKLKSY